jgi:hypothetical protein
MASSIPSNPDALLTREKTAAALTEAGYPTAPATLATKATRGGGPPYRLFGVKPLYRWGDSIAWAQSRLSQPRRSTSEAAAGDQSTSDARRRRPHSTPHADQQAISSTA